MEYKIWDSGRAVTVVEENCAYDNPKDYCLDDWSLGCFLLDPYKYSIFYNCNKKKLDSFISERIGHITKINYKFDDANLDNASLEEKKKKLLEERLSDYTKVMILLNSEYNDDFVILPVYAYIHGGISLSTSSFRDAFDSGLAGICWSFGESEEYLKDSLQKYDDYMNERINEYEVSTYKKKDGKWMLDDQLWYFAEEWDWDLLDFKIEDVVDNFDDSLYNEVYNEMKKNLKVEDCIKYLMLEED